MGINKTLVYENMTPAQLENATCAICTDLLLDPVVLKTCEHHYCRVCLDQWIDGQDFIVTCPECRQSFADDDKQGCQVGPERWPNERVHARAPG